MQVRTENQSVLAREIKIVPAWVWGLAVIVFVAAQWYFNIAVVRNPHAPPAWARPVLGLLAGFGGGAYLLLIAYVNRDSKRRGMSAVLWTLVAICIPNGLGILLYFVLRQPLRRACPQCGNAVQVEFNFCPRCSYKLSPSCPQCRRLIGVDDVYCPYCGTSLGNQAASIASLPTRLPG
jgi:RNA polymerase subunit RPABC4/transcription elongation factor Spt4